MKKPLLTWATTILFAFSALSQPFDGDFRSVASGNWNAIATWERYNGASWVAATSAPTSLDGIISIRSSHTVTTAVSGITADQVIVDAGGTLVINNNFTLNDDPSGDDMIVDGTLSLSVQTLGGLGRLTVNGTLNWTSGTLDVVSEISITGVCSLSTSGTKTLASSLTNNNDIIWIQGAFQLSTATLTNSSSGSIIQSGNDQFTNQASPNTFINAGTFDKSGTGLSSFAVPLTNSGFFNVNSGSISYSQGFTNSGTVTIAAGATLTIGITFSNSGIFNFTGGTLVSSQGFNHNAGSQFTGSGDFNVNGGTVTLNDDMIMPAAIDFDVNGTITGTGDLEVNNNFTFQGITGTGTLTLNDSATWAGGTLDRKLIILSTKTLTLNNTSRILQDSLIINGSCNWSAGNISFSNGTMINNGTLTHTGSGVLSNSAGTNLFDNNGTYTRSDISAIFNSILINNDGIFNINSGNYTVGHFTNTGTLSFDGTGTINFNSSLLNSGTLSFAGTVTVNSLGAFNFNPGSVIMGSSGNLVIAGGTFTLGIDLNVPAGITFNNESGTITGPGNLVVNNTFTFNSITGSGSLTINGNATWEGGSLARNLTIPVGRTLTLISGSNKTISNSTLTINGAMTWNDGGLVFDNGTLNNTGSFTQASNTSISQIGGSSLFNNSGTYQKTSTGSVQITVPYTNSGTTTISAGSWSIHSSFNNSGTFALTTTGSVTSVSTFNNTGTINFSGATFNNNGTFNFDLGSQFTGSGIFNVSAGTMNINIDLTIPVGIQFNQGGGTITGAGNLTVNSDFTFNSITGTGLLIINGNSTWQGGTLGRNLTIGLGSTITLTTASSKVLNSVTVTNNGIMNWNSGSITLISASLLNNGTLNQSATEGFSGSSGSNSISNSGTYNKLSAGSPSITIPIVNTGTIDLETGGMVLNSTMNNSGTINLFASTSITSNNTWTNSGAINFNPGSSLANQSIFIFDPGSSFSGTGSLTTSNTFTINASLTFPSTINFQQLAGTINGNGNLIINNDFNFTTIDGSGSLTINGNSNWNGGVLHRSLTIGVGQTLTLDSNSSNRALDSVSIIVNGSLVSNSGTLSLNNSTLTVNGTYTHNSINGFVNSGGTSLITINGTFTKSHTASVLYNVPITNTGTFAVTGGDLTIGSTFINSGSFNFSSGGVLSSTNSFTNSGNFSISGGGIFNSSGIFNHETGSVISGSGSFNTSGTMNLNIGFIVPSGIIFNQTAGTINGSGDLEVSNPFTFATVLGSGKLEIDANATWVGGTLGRNLTVPGSLSLTCSTSVSKVLSANLLIEGTMNMTGGTMSFSNGHLTNAGTINHSTGENMNTSGGTNSFTNDGLFHKTGVGALNIGIPVTNTADGIFQGIGTYSFTTLINNGTIAPGNPVGILAVQGAQPFSSGSTLAIRIENNSGPGTGYDQVTRGSNLTLDGNLVVTEAAGVANGSFTIISVSSGTISASSFSNTVLPPGYVVVVNSNSVVLVRSVTLPVILTSFDAELVNKQVRLRWETAQESNTSHFEIERSKNGVDYIKIGVVQARGNSNSPVNYSMVDPSPLNGRAYYRLRIVDIDNSYEYSKTASVSNLVKGYFRIVPNPASDHVMVDLDADYQSVEIFDLKGRMIRKFARSADDLYVVSGLPQGVYVMKVMNGESVWSSQLMIK